MFLSRKIILSLISIALISASAMFAESTINFVVQYEPMTDNWLKEVIKSYEAKYPDRKVKLNIIGGAQSDYYTKTSLMMKSGTSVDALYEDSFMLKSDVNAGVLAPIDVSNWDDWKNFYPSIRDSVSINGKVYGIPLSSDTRGLYYNIELFKMAGIKIPWQPKNWNEILDAARKIKEKCPGVYPITLNAAANGEATAMQTFEMLLYGTNDTLYKDGKWIVKSPGFLNSLKFIDTLFKDKLTPELAKLINPQYGNYMASDWAPHNKVAIILDGCWIMGNWIQKHPKTLANYQFVAMPTESGQEPGFTSMSGGWLFSVNAKSKNQEDAANFIKFAINKENALKYSLATSQLTPRQDVAEMKEYPEIMRAATSYIKYTHFRPANEQYPIVSPLIQTAVESVATGQSTPEQAMNAYAESVKRTLGANYIAEASN
jgi:multiple sugar transport system substrate-binding protein